MVTRTLTITPEVFTKMISGLVAAGVTFEAEEQGGLIVVTFTGGY